MRNFFAYTLAAMAIALTAAAPCETALHPPLEAELPIVMYHLVTEKSKYLGKYGVTPQELEQDLEFLANNNFTTVVMRDVFDFVNHGTPLPENPIMLTFDDGNEGDYTYVLPLLKKYDMKAVLAIIGSAADKCSAGKAENPTARYPNLTWSEIAELHNSGHVEIQSHSYNLHTPPTGSGKRSSESPEAYQARLRKDLERLQKSCEEHLGYTPNTFVYPLGVIGENSREVLEELGLLASISCQEGMNTLRHGDPNSFYRLLRTNRPHNRTIESIINSIR